MLSLNPKKREHKRAAAKPEITIMPAPILSARPLALNEERKPGPA